MNTYKTELKDLRTTMEVLKADKAKFTKDGDNVGRLRASVQIEYIQHRIDVITGKAVESLEVN